MPSAKFGCTPWDCKNNQKTNGKGRKLCNYEKLNEILGQQPASSPVKVVESMSRRRRLPNIDDDASDSADDSLQEGADNTQDEHESDTDDDGM